MATIVLVEADAPLGEVYWQLLTDDGYDVQLVPTVREALARLTDHRSDLLVIDQALPDGIGIDEMHALSAPPERGGIPMLVLTKAPAPSFPPTVQVLVKPFTLQLLRETVQHIVPRGAAQMPTPS